MSKNPAQKIFRRDAVERLRNELRTGNSLESYFKESFAVKENDLLPSTIAVSGKVPALKMPKGDIAEGDLDNAIKLHEYYLNLDETQASDPRLWTYLSHVEFRKYTIERWGLEGTYSDLDDNDKKQKAINYLLEHWFISGNDRDLRRHAVARLWWAAHLTYAPWERDPEFFGALKCEDAYFYTRTLLSTQDIYQQVLERAMGRSDRVLISVLNFLANNPKVASSRDSIRTLMKELNLAYGTKKIITLDFESLNKLIAKTALEI